MPRGVPVGRESEISVLVHSFSSVKPPEADGWFTKAVRLKWIRPIPRVED